ncbi:MAG: LamG domain-containing protein, partial [Planctomycetota bacterium]
MWRKLTFQISVLVALGLLNSASAVDKNWTGTESSNWCTGGNWSPAGAPGPEDRAFVGVTANHDPVIDGSVCADVNIHQLWGPGYGSNGDQVMTIVDANVNVQNKWWWDERESGARTGTATVNIIGNTNMRVAVDDTDLYYWACIPGRPGTTSILNISGNENGEPNVFVNGTIRPIWYNLDGLLFELNISAGYLRCRNFEWFRGSGRFNMSGGTIVCEGGISFSGENGGTLEWNMTGGLIQMGGALNVGESSDAISIVNLDDGTVECGDFDVDDEAYWSMDINEGVLKIEGDKKAKMQAWVDDGHITGRGNTVRPVVVYQDGYTILGFDLVQMDASAPDPRSGTPGRCPPDVNLSWTPGIYAVDHNIYFGTSMDDVNESASPYATHVAANSWTTPELKVGTTYLWRVETVNDVCEASPWPGGIWSFSTRSPGATDPWPHNTRGRPMASVSQLVWTASCFADTHKVYFGEDFRPSLVLFEDDFSDGLFDPNWTESGAWDVWYPNDPNFGPHDHNLARATGTGTLEMDVSVDASDACSMQVEFEFRKTVEITDDKIKLYYWDGSEWDFKKDLNSLDPNDEWVHYGDDVNINDPYLINGFKIKFESTISSGEVYIDDVRITNTWPAASKWYEGRVDGNSHSVSVEPRTRYHWRIDTVVDGNTYKGSWWTFSTGRSNPGVLLHYSFTGTQGNGLPDYPTAIPDNTGDFEFYKYVDPCGSGSVKYGTSNPVYDADGTSAAFDPCAGLYRLDPCAAEPEKPDLLRLDGYQYTIEMWIRPEALVEEKEDQYLIGKSGANTWSIYINDPGECGGCDNELRWVRNGGQIDVEIEDWLDWANPEWLHVAVVFDQSQSDDDRAKMFFYGQQVGDSDGASLNAADNNSPVAVGFRVPADGNVTNGTEYFQGLIDEVRILDV